MAGLATKPIHQPQGPSGVLEVQGVGLCRVQRGALENGGLLRVGRATRLELGGGGGRVGCPL